MAHEIKLYRGEVFGFCLSGKDHGALHDSFTVGIEYAFYPGAHLPASHLGAEIMELCKVYLSEFLRKSLHKSSHESEIVIDPYEGNKIAGHPLELAIEHDEAFTVDRPF